MTPRPDILWPKRLTWHGCYDDGWRGVIVNEGFAHPAKMAKGLLERIVQFGLDERFWRKGDTLADPFGGIGTTGLVCAYRGLRCVSMELEPRFVGLSYATFYLHVDKWQKLGAPLPIILQGDSRQFAAGVRAAGIVTSPPYADSQTQGNKAERYGYSHYGGGEQLCWPQTYGTTPGQIGALPPGDVAAVVTSPPFADSDQDYAQTEASRKRLVAKGEPRTGCGLMRSRHSMTQGYGHTPGNIGNLPAGIVTSPPWEKCLESGGGIEVDKLYDGMVERWGRSGSKADRAKQVALMSRRVQRRSYGADDAQQIGNASGDTYWSAMRQVYHQCLLALRPGGVLVVVVKDYVKAGKRVPLCRQTRRLLHSLGFRLTHRIKAMLVKEKRTAGLFGEIVERTERKSFFRRLAERNGSPRIDWEEVLIATAPAPSGGLFGD